MKCCIDLDIDGVVANYDELPEDNIDGVVWEFRIDQDPSRQYTVVAVPMDIDDSTCRGCPFNLTEEDVCPYDPDSGDYVCQLYGPYKFKLIDDVLEEL